MTIEVEDADGTVIEFPDNTPPQTITSVMRRRDQERQGRARAQPQQRPQQPNPAMQREAARYAARRNFQRGAMPFGLGYLTVPLQNMVLDPARREALGRSAQGVVRDVQQIPSLNVGRLASDTAQAVEQGVRNLPQTAAAVATHIPQIARAATYGPFMDEEQAQRRLDLARLQGDQQGQQQAAGEANAQTAGIGLNVAGPLVLGSNPSLLRAGATAAAMDAPFALSRNSEQPLQQRLPGALAEMAGVGAFGAGLQGVASSAPQVLRQPSRTVQRAAEFERAGVRPMLAATRGNGAAPLTMAIAENPIGGNVRRNLQNSADDVATRSREIAAGYGQHGQPENVGESVQAAVNRFARDADAKRPSQQRPELISTRDWSFRAKANALYDDVFQLITRDEMGHLEGQTGVRASADNARQELARIQREVQAPNVAQVVTDPTLQRIAGALEADRNALRFNDLRRLRTWVREARSRPMLTQTIDDASMARLEQALTQDIYESALTIGGEYAAQRLRRVDQFYRAGTQRIQNALQAFADRSGRGAYDRVVSLAREGGPQNTRQLQALRNSLKPDEWREVSATVVDGLGRPNPGNAQALEAGAFSLENFVTNYAKLSAEGRRILFGGAGRQALMAELDTLARVAGYLKQVRGFTNFSRSGSSIQNISTLGAVGGSVAGAAMGNVAPLAALAAMGLTARITGEMLTNPAFVRWLTSAPKNGGRVGGLRAQSAALASLAARDPALVPLAAELSQRVPAANDNQGSTPPQRAGQAR